MNLTDILLILVIAAVLGFSGLYVYRSKKSGKKCIGCPDSGCCSGNCPGCHHK